MTPPAARQTSGPAVRYELHRDKHATTYSVHRVEVIGPFVNREAARQYMIDTQADREALDARRMPPPTREEMFTDG